MEESADKRSGTISLKKLALITLTFFGGVATIAVICHYYLNRDKNAGDPDAASVFSFSLGGASKPEPVNVADERKSILSMDTKHLQLLGETIFEEIKKGREAFKDITDLLEEYKDNRNISSRTKSFINLMLGFLSLSSGDENFKVMESVIRVAIRRFSTKPAKK